MRPLRIKPRLFFPEFSIPLGLVIVMFSGILSGCGDRAERTYRSGLNLARQKKYDRAIVEARRLIQIEGKSPRAHNLLGQIYRKQNLYNRAIEEFTLALEGENTDPVPAYNLGCLYRELEEWPRAVGFFKKALELDPAYSPALYRLAAAYADLGQPEEAEKYFRKFLAAGPARPAFGHNNLGVILWEKGERDEAHEEFRRAVEADPEFAEALFNYGVASIQGGRENRKGVDSLLEYLRLKPRSPQAPELRRILEKMGAMSGSGEGLFSRDEYLARGESYEQAGQYRQAAVEYHRALELDPSSSRAQRRLGIIYDQFLGDKIKAIGYYEACLAANKGAPEAGEIIDLLNKARRDVGKKALARGGLKPTASPPAGPPPPPTPVSAEPRSGGDFYRQGRRLEGEGRIDRAREMYLKALESDAGLAAPRYRLGLIYLDRDKYAEAVESLLEARRLDSSLPVRAHLSRAYLRLGSRLDGRGEYEAALEAYRAARNEGAGRAAEEGLWKTHRSAYRALLKREDYAGAVSHLNACLEIKDDVAEDYAALGDIYLRHLGRQEEAESAYRTYLKLAPAGKEAGRIDAFLNPPPTPLPTATARPAPSPPVPASVYYNRGVKLQQQGRSSGAVNAYRSALRADPLFYQAYYNLGVVYNKEQDYSRALAAYKKVVEIKPDFARAHLAIFNLYYHHFRMKNLARPYARDYVRLAPGTPQAEKLSRWLNN